MNSGVYLLTFKNGEQYVGKTVNFERRFAEHAASMKKGSAAKPIQLAYNNHGLPTARILVKCHTDHIDLMETYYICKLQPQLNTIGGIKLTNKDLLVLEEQAELLKLSTVEHLLMVEGLRKEVLNLNNKLTGHEMYDLVTEQQEKIDRLQEEIESLQVDLAIAHRKPWYKRLFEA